MFSVLEVSTYLTLTIYSLFYDWNLLKIWIFIFSVYLIIGHFTGEKKHNGVRKTVRMGSWSLPGDPSAFVKIELDITEAEKFLNEQNSKNDGKKKLTLTHIALKSIANGMKKRPNDYGKIIFGKFVKIEDVDINTLIDIGGKDLGQVTVRKCDKKGIRGIADSLKGRVGVVKKDECKEHKKKTGLAKIVPSSIACFGSQVIAFLNYNFNISIPSMSIPHHAFGQILFTNVSGFQVNEAFAPLCSFTRNICTIVLCTPEMRPRVVEGKIEARKMVNMMITFDHRYQDGSGCFSMIKGVKDVWEKPAEFY